MAIVERRIYFDIEAIPEFIQRSAPSYFVWSGSDDELVRFVYANQGPLFVEDAVVFKTWSSERGEHFYIRRDVGERIRGSWETDDCTGIRAAAQRVIDSWEKGDLAAAVRGLDDILNER